METKTNNEDKLKACSSVLNVLDTENGRVYYRFFDIDEFYELRDLYPGGTNVLVKKNKDGRTEITATEFVGVTQNDLNIFFNGNVIVINNPDDIKNFFDMSLSVLVEERRSGFLDDDEYFSLIEDIFTVGSQIKENLKITMISVVKVYPPEIIGEFLFSSSVLFAEDSDRGIYFGYLL